MAVQISFYVLSEPTDDLPTADRLLAFVCRLTQTVLAKSSHSLLIVDDDASRLDALDEWLWTFSNTSFIPHERISDNTTASGTAPVALVATMPTDFDGVVLNLAAEPLVFTDDSCRPDRVLEIIASDDVSKQQGRDKYRHYQQLGMTLVHHRVS